MNIKHEVIALAIRLVADKTNLIRKPDSIEVLITQLFGGETYDRRLARSISEETERAVEATKRFRTNRKFKKITTDF